MFAAAAAAASGGQRTGGTRFPPNLFHGNNKSGLDSPPASLENRSTPGSLDLSRSKDDYLEDNDLDLPPTMVKMEAMVYPKIDSEGEDEGPTRLEKRVFPDEDSENETVEDLSAKKPKYENNETGENNNSSDEKLMSHDAQNLKVRDEFKETGEQTTEQSS